MSTVMAIASGFIATQGASADPPTPLFWTWDPMPSGAAGDHFKESIRVVVGADPTATAGEVAAQWNSDYVCVLLQNFGNHVWSSHPLWRNTLDHTNYPIQQWLTPFHYFGAVQAEAWMDDFLEALINTPGGLDTPTTFRFHFDSEDGVTPANGQSPDLYEHIKAKDPRFVWPLQGFASTSLADLDALEQPTTNTSAHWFHPDNQDWCNWVTPIYKVTSNAALVSAAFDPIKDAWPPGAVKVSNYSYNVRVDGTVNLLLDDIADGFHNRQWVEHDFPDWYRYGYAATTDMQSFDLYPNTHPEYAFHVLGSHLDVREATIVRTRATVDKCIHSFGGGHEHEIMPWITIPGFPICWDDDLTECNGGTVLIDETWSGLDCRRQLAVYRSRDIQEFFLWWNHVDTGQPESWATDADLIEFANAVDDVWGHDLLAVDSGGKQIDPDTVRFGLYDFVNIVPHSGAFARSINARFSTPGTSGWNATYEVIVEARGTATGQLYIDAELQSQPLGNYVQATSTTPDPLVESHRRVFRFEFPAGMYEDSNGDINVRVTIGGAAGMNLDVDLIQLYQTN